MKIFHYNRILTGNGIIIDVFKRSRAQPRKPHTQDRGGPLEPYRGRTLVENNLVFDNGGRGIVCADDGDRGNVR